jgi:hypothetical protein
MIESVCDILHLERFSIQVIKDVLIMMYLYMILSDETEIVHFHIIKDNGVQCVEVHFEPIHVYIGKGKPNPNATKVWLTASAGCIVA